MNKEVAWQLVTLAYRDWVKAYDIVKAVADEKNDGTEPSQQAWEKMHNIRVRNAREELERAKKVLDITQAWQAEHYPNWMNEPTTRS